MLPESQTQVQKKTIRTRTASKKKGRFRTAAALKAGLIAPSKLGKNYILDTNVLLHDPSCLTRFADNHLCIPLDVICELDRFKNEQTERGANARAAHRHIAQLFDGHEEDVTRGVPTMGGGTLRMVFFEAGEESEFASFLTSAGIAFPSLDKADHRIIASGVLVQKANPSMTSVLVTKDLNLRIKALAVGLRSEDYLNDKVEVRDIENYGIRTVPVDTYELQRFASSGKLELEGDRTQGIAVNEYVMLDSGKQMPARYVSQGYFRRLVSTKALHIRNGASIRPINLGQQCFVDALLDPEISLVTCYGHAGTGKTLVAMAAGLHSVFAGDFDGITVSRPIVSMGDTLGFLPGTLQEKMKPWLQPIYDALEILLPKRNTGKQKKADPETGAVKPYDHLIQSGVVEIEALCYIRGRSIPNRYFVLDEAQQLTPLEAKTVVTRMSRGSKLVLVGDPGQIDNPYVDSRSNGLVYTRNRLKGETMAAHVSLSKGERSDLAEAGARLM